MLFKRGNTNDPVRMAVIKKNTNNNNNKTIQTLAGTPPRVP